MEEHIETVRVDGDLESTHGFCRNACPVCGGELTEAHRLRRCARCGFSLCEGCDGENAYD
jgi:hypothetical protein